MGTATMTKDESECTVREVEEQQHKDSQNHGGLEEAAGEANNCTSVTEAASEETAAVPIKPFTAAGEPEMQAPSKEELLTVSVDHHGALGFYFERRTVGAGVKLGTVANVAVLQPLGIRQGMIVHTIDGRVARNMSLELAQAAVRKAERPFEIVFTRRCEYTWDEPGTLEWMLYSDCYDDKEGPKLPGLKLQAYPSSKRNAMVSQVDYSTGIAPAIKPGLLVESVNGECMAGISFDDVITKIRTELRPVTLTFCEITAGVCDPLT